MHRYCTSINRKTLSKSVGDSEDNVIIWILNFHIKFPCCIFWSKMWVPFVVSHFVFGFFARLFLKWRSNVSTWLVKFNLFSEVKLQVLWFPAIVQRYKYQVDCRFITTQRYSYACVSLLVLWWTSLRYFHVHSLLRYYGQRKRSFSITKHQYPLIIYWISIVCRGYSLPLHLIVKAHLEDGGKPNILPTFFSVQKLQSFFWGGGDCCFLDSQFFPEYLSGCIPL